MDYYGEEDNRWDSANFNSTPGNSGPFGDFKPEDNLETVDLATVTKNEKKRKPVTRRVLLNAEELCGNRGLVELRNTMADVKFRGKGHEFKDLNTMMTKLEYWAHRLCPSMPFDAVLERIEDLGSKRVVKTALAEIRHGESSNDKTDKGQDNPDTITTANIDDDEAGNGFQTETFEGSRSRNDYGQIEESQGVSSVTLTDEQRQRMEANKKRAEELRAMRSQKIQGDIQGSVDVMDFDDLDDYFPD